MLSIEFTAEWDR